MDDKTYREQEDIKDKRAAHVSDHAAEHQGPADEIVYSDAAREVMAATHQDEDFEVSLEPLSQWQLAWRRFKKHSTVGARRADVRWGTSAGYLLTP